MERRAHAIPAAAARIACAHAGGGETVAGIAQVAGNMIQPAAGNACPSVAADEAPPVAANVAHPVTATVVPHGAATMVPLTAASVVDHVARNATAGVVAAGAGAGPASEVLMDKGKRPMVETDEGDEEVDLSPDDLHFVLNRMFETRKRYINTIRAAKKQYLDCAHCKTNLSVSTGCNAARARDLSAQEAEHLGGASETPIPGIGKKVWVLSKSAAWRCSYMI
jgi:hypothetical protein